MRTLEKLRLRAADDRGAADPILVIVGIAVSLIMLVGGTFAIGGFIAYADNQAARGDLDRVATAQGHYISENDRYASLAVGPDVAVPNTELIDSAASFSPSESVNLKVRSSPSGWAAVAGSGSGNVYLRTSTSDKNHELSPDVANPQYGAPVESDRNLFRNPGASTTTDLTTGVVSSATVTGTAAVAAPWAPSGRALQTTLSAVGTQPVRQFAFQPRIYTSFQQAAAAGTPLVGETVTIVVQLRSPAPFALHSIIPVSSAGSSRSAIAATQAQTVPANTTLTAYATFVMSEADYGTSSRINFFVGNLTVGQTIEMSSVNMYVGAYDSSREWFSGASVASGPTSYGWAGAANASASIKYTRPILMAQPSGITLPAGITWAEVAGDASEVKQ
jgi:hypothetical protein